MVLSNRPVIVSGKERKKEYYGNNEEGNELKLNLVFGKTNMKQIGGRSCAIVLCLTFCLFSLKVFF